jgi:phosphohistidine swiveling domain-containing protein
VLGLTQRYLPLREEQRFLWQKTLALQRSLFLLLAQRMATAGVLTTVQDVFFLTKEELHDYARNRGAGTGFAALTAARQRQFWRLCQQHDSDPELSYPTFLQGDHPLESARPLQASQWLGQPVSPGLARGRAVVLHSPRGLTSIRPGDVLVTHSADPGWTPVFGKLSALVLECGGQLSHGAMVAREYGLPAVTGIPGIMRALHDGDILAVDGSTGSVTKLTAS